MEKNKIIDALQEEIKNSTSLSKSDKFWGKWILDRLKLYEENNNRRELIECLKNSYEDSEDFFEKKVLSEAIEVLNRDIRKTDNILQEGEYSSKFDDYTPITFKEVLESISDNLEITEDGKIILTPKISATELLERKVNIGKDDGMGYSPNGFNGVFQSYIGDDNDIKLWI